MTSSFTSSAPTHAIVANIMAQQNPSFWSKLSGLYNKSGGNDVWGSGLSSIMDSYAQGKEDKASAQAYRQYLNFLNGIANGMAKDLTARADKYDTKLQNQFNSAEPEFQQEAYTTLPELEKLKEDIVNQNTETQRGDLRRINAILAQQGVRGGQAAILANRAMGETSKDTLRQINELAYNDAANRQNARLNYYSNKALTPWQTMSKSYGESMVGANNALSNAQGNVYQNAYTNMMNNYMNAQRKKSGGLGSKIGGVIGGAVGTAYGGPVGGSLGSAAGSYIGGQF